MEPTTSSGPVRKVQKTGAGSKQHCDTAVQEKAPTAKSTAASRIKRLDARDDIAKCWEVPYSDWKQLDRTHGCDGTLEGGPVRSALGKRVVGDDCGAAQKCNYHVLSAR
jgi:hypothetical protein